MLRLFLLLLCFLHHNECFLQTKEKIVSLNILLMKGQPRPTNVPRGQSSDPDLKLVIINQTDTVATFWQTWNIWGDNTIRFELSRNDSVFNLYYTSFCSTNNYPQANILQPGDSMLVYIKFERCFETGPCPCLFSTPKNFPFPTNNLNGARLRAFYKLDLENHQREFTSSIEFARYIDSMNNSGDKMLRQQEKNFRSFVTSELGSNFITINFDSW